MRYIRYAAIISLAIPLLSGTVLAKGGGGFSGGGGGGFKSSGGGSFGSSSGSLGGGSFGSSFGSSSGKSFSVPSSSPSMPHVTISAPPPVSAPAARAPVLFDSGAARAQHTEESRANFRANSPDAPKPDPKPATSWNDRPIFPSRPAETARPDYRPQPSWAPTRTVVVERQVTSSGSTDMYFWLWLMEHNNQRQRDDWVYNNRNRIDQSQMDELRRRDSGIDDRLKKLEADGVKPDPNYRIPDSDIKDKTVTAPAETSATSPSHKGFWLTIGLIMLLGAFVYLFFFKRFPSRRFA